MDEQKRRDDELFAALNRSKKQQRRKRLLTALAITAVIVIILLIVFANLRKRVEANIAANADEVLRYEVEYGSVSTTVSGSGTISDVDTEAITVPEGVEIDEVLAKTNTHVVQGDILATVDIPSVLSTMADVQDAIAELDTQLQEASNAASNASLTTGTSGRVKRIYAENGSDVAAVMYEHGAIALLSLDGYMAVDIDVPSLAAGDTVKVIRADGKELNGRVDTRSDLQATILVTDNGPELDEIVTICSAEGEELGSGALYIHNALAVTGFNGTVSHVAVRENQSVYAGGLICSLKDTSYSARYDTILKQRREKEDDLRQLLALRQSGALRAPFDGTVLTVDYGNDESAETDSSQSGSSMGMGLWGFSSDWASFYGSSSVGTTSSTTADSDTDGVTIVTMSHDEQMSVVISVDESDILALQNGQTAEVSIESIGDQKYVGTVTEVDKTANSSSGVTSYSAEISFDKGPNMLSGMTAEVVIRIEGTEDVLIVPTDAVHRTSAISYVYTEYDANTDTYGGMKTIETGISNDDFTAVTSGLELGDVVFYTERETGFFFGFPGAGGSYSGGYGGPGNYRR
ncbi:MAG: hypothetical protein IJ179_01925 [Oscillospiraceae bacterium]|nr:hypothetical protein [Oscillospiraceae bacterium]